ncbi:hypothetical protein BV898_03943 [Hypsibius exemplaris]|uniref:Uncharacterized protein n=1 Tax=Hypsibius exemplaris TaxID=2072580 RepID=A0A1W0X3U7_HYPEX|nr:hypothetical protein BV898_03943 [Hypsibius exemplaris]
MSTPDEVDRTFNYLNYFYLGFWILQCKSSRFSGREASGCRFPLSHRYPFEGREGCCSGGRLRFEVISRWLWRHRWTSLLQLGEVKFEIEEFS